MRTPNEWHGMLARLCGVVVKSITGLPEVCAEGTWELGEIREVAPFFFAAQFKGFAVADFCDHLERMVPP